MKFSLKSWRDFYKKGIWWELLPLGGATALHLAPSNPHMSSSTSVNLLCGLPLLVSSALIHVLNHFRLLQTTAPVSGSTKTQRSSFCSSSPETSSEQIFHLWFHSRFQLLPKRQTGLFLFQLPPFCPLLRPSPLRLCHH